MARPRFSWDYYDETASLILKVTSGERETTWRVGPRPNSSKLADVLLEVVEALGDYESDVPAKPLRAPEKPAQSPEVSGDEQMSEEGSAELRAAKARSVERTGKAWFSNMEDDAESLPLYERGHASADK